MKWSKWKIGLFVAILTGVAQTAVSGASADHFSWHSLVMPVMFNVGTNLLLYLKQHPVEDIQTDTAFLERDPAARPPLQRTQEP